MTQDGDDKWWWKIDESREWRCERSWRIRREITEVMRFAMLLLLMFSYETYVIHSCSSVLPISVARLSAKHGPTGWATLGREEKSSRSSHRTGVINALQGGMIRNDGNMMIKKEWYIWCSQKFRRNPCYSQPFAAAFWRDPIQCSPERVLFESCSQSSISDFARAIMGMYVA